MITVQSSTSVSQAPWAPTFPSVGGGGRPERRASPASTLTHQSRDQRFTIEPKGFALLTLQDDTAVALLRELDLFEGLGDDELRILAEKADLVRWEAGEVVFQEGDYGDACYVIERGQIKITRRLVDGQPIALAQAGRGAMVGELALFASERRAGTLQAIEPTTALRISRADLMALLHGNAEAAISMAIHVARLLERATDRQFSSATSTVNGRILSALLAQVEARQSIDPRKDNVELVGSTSDLARTAGTQKDDAARVLHWLENEGVLRIKRGRIIVESPAALRGYLD